MVEYEGSVGIPSGFTPNGDGFNDIFFVDGYGFELFDFKIYNRYGQLVFESLDPTIGWDGTSLDGRQLNPGTFAYVLDYSFYGQAGQVLSGNLTLLK